MSRLLIIASNPTRKAPPNDAPSLDYFELKQKLDGDLMGSDFSESRLYQGYVRTVEKRLKLDIFEAFAAYNKLANYEAVLSLSEKAALPLAVMAQLTKRHIPHFLIAHKLSSGLKTYLFKLGFHQSLTGIICVSRKQTEYATQILKIPANKVHFVYDKVDQNYFCPTGEPTEDYILAVGQEQRDYMTLLKAVEGTNIKLKVVASSPWSTSQIQVQDMSNVQVLSHIPFTELRSLYARASLVVLPLHDVDYAAGVNGLLEAMSMGKPTIVTRTAGIADYVEENETAIYTSPMDAIALREHILELRSDSAKQKRLGANARQLVVERINLDRYVQNIQEIIGHRT